MPVAVVAAVDHLVNALRAHLGESLFDGLRLLGRNGLDDTQHLL